MSGTLEQFFTTQIAPLVERIDTVEKRAAEVEARAASAISKSEAAEKAASDVSRSLDDRARALMTTLTGAIEETDETMASHAATVERVASEAHRIDNVVNKLCAKVDHIEADLREHAALVAGYAEIADEMRVVLGGKTQPPASRPAQPPPQPRVVKASEMLNGKSKAATAAAPASTCPSCGARNADTRKKGRLTVCSSCMPQARA